MKSLLTKSLKTIRRAAAAGLLAMLASSCQWMSEDYDEIVDSSATQYINITISVSASNVPVTRSPQGGEYGDGWEKGIEDRENVENAVNNITLIFFKDAAGVNTTNTNTEVLYVKKYNVHEATLDDYYYPRDYYYHTHKETEPKTGYYNQEIIYTTGDQPLEENTIEVGETYQVLVVANEDPNVAVHDKIVAVRDKLLNLAYTGTGVGINATNFVMTSESPASVTLNNPTVINDENKAIYYFDCIHMERMAARIDYWAENSNGYKTSSDNAAYTTSGYEYFVKKPDGTNSEDRFVLTSITPFNLNMGTTGNEYIFKRTNDATDPYLHDETTTNWVTDPYTSGKNAASHPDWMVSTLTSVVSNFANNLANDYKITMASQQETGKKLSIGNKDDIIIAYPKENTLSPNGDSPLYYYATGLAFEGYYYRKGTGTGERRVYYHFIRHQGELNTAYDAWTADNIDNAKTTNCPQTTAMNFGIVRNNIYRISVNQVTDGGMLQLRIAVHDWRNVEHPTIYI